MIQKMSLGVFFLFLAAAAFAYDNSPSQNIILPEVIWAAATGGGTWTTDVQIVDRTGSSIVHAIFYYGANASYSRVVSLWTGGARNSCAVFPNILSYMQSLDPSFNYYGRVGALWLITQDSSHKIQATAITRNGDYGKSFPGLAWVDSNTANKMRNMMILGLRNEGFRVAIGCFNASDATMAQVEFALYRYDGTCIGVFSKSFNPGEFKVFNPFRELGITYYINNCWLEIFPDESTSYGDGTRGLMVFGSLANNTTNDTFALIAVQRD